MLLFQKLIIAGIIASSLGVAGAAGAVAFKEGMFAQVSGQQAAATAVAQVGGVAKDVDYKYKQHLGGRYKVEILKTGSNMRLWLMLKAAKYWR